MIVALLVAFAVGGFTVHAFYWLLDKWEDRYHGERSKIIVGAYNRQLAQSARAQVNRDADEMGLSDAERADVMRAMSFWTEADRELGKKP